MMSNRGALLLMAISAMLIMALPASAQDDISIIFKRHLKDLQKLHKQKTEDEQKLDSMLFDLLRTAEAADTSHDEQVILNYYMQHFPRMDSKGRVYIVIEIHSYLGLDDILALVRSNDGIVDSYRSVPCYVIGYVHPKFLRTLCSSSAVRDIRTPAPPMHGPVKMK